MTIFFSIFNFSRQFQSEFELKYTQIQIYVFPAIFAIFSADFFICAIFLVNLPKKFVKRCWHSIYIDITPFILTNFLFRRRVIFYYIEMRETLFFFILMNFREIVLKFRKSNPDLIIRDCTKIYWIHFHEFLCFVNFLIFSWNQGCKAIQNHSIFTTSSSKFVYF